MTEVARAATGEELKEWGMALALSHAPAWRDRVYEHVDKVAYGVRLTSEDIIDACGLPNEDYGPNSHNAVGGIMSAMHSKGLLAHSGSYAKARRPITHASILSIWVRTRMSLAESNELARRRRREADAARREKRKSA